MTDADDSSAPAPAPDPAAVVKSRSYIVLLVLGAVIGVPVATVAYFFLDAVSRLQTEIFTDLPKSLGFHGEPLWWPLPWLTLSGFLVALAIRYLPGTGWPRAFGGLQVRRPSAARRALRHRCGRVRHPQPRRGVGPGGTADRHWQRAGRSRGASASSGTRHPWPQW